MKFLGKFKDYQTGFKGRYITLQVDSYIYAEMFKQFDNDKQLTIEIKEVKSKRSLQQNAYLWALIREIDVAMNGKPTDELDIYIMLLDKANAKVEYIGALEETEPKLKEVFRTVKKIKPISLNGVDGYMYKCYLGSSKMDSKEMALLIDTALDVASELGINTSYWSDLLK